MGYLLLFLRTESERLIRHALVPVIVYFFAHRIGEGGATAVGEIAAIAVSYAAVLAWSAIRERLANLRDKKPTDNNSVPKHAGESVSQGDKP